MQIACGARLASFSHEFFTPTLGTAGCPSPQALALPARHLVVLRPRRPCAEPLLDMEPEGKRSTRRNEGRWDRPGFKHRLQAAARHREVRNCVAYRSRLGPSLLLRFDDALHLVDPCSCRSRLSFVASVWLFVASQHSGRQDMFYARRPSSIRRASHSHVENHRFQVQKARSRRCGFYPSFPCHLFRSTFFWHLDENALTKQGTALVESSLTPPPCP